MRHGVVKTDVVMHCIRPKLDGEIGAIKHCHQGIGDSLMWALAGAVLTGSIGPGEFDGVAGVGKQVDDLLTLAEFATLVESDIFAGDGLVKTILSKPLVEELNRRPFVGEAADVKGARGVVRDEAVLVLTVETDRSQVTVGTLRLLDDKTSVHGNALIALGGMARVGRNPVGTTELGAGADWTLLKFAGGSNDGDTVGRLMGVLNPTEM
jgi:hypothetical protein